MAANKSEIFRCQLQLMHISMNECIEHNTSRYSLIINDKKISVDKYDFICEIRAQTLKYTSLALSNMFELIQVLLFASFKIDDMD
jgi:hypothetical protein